VDEWKPLGSGMFFMRGEFSAWLMAGIYLVWTPTVP